MTEFVLHHLDKQHSACNLEGHVVDHQQGASSWQVCQTPPSAQVSQKQRRRRGLDGKLLKLDGLKDLQLPNCLLFSGG